MSREDILQFINEIIEQEHGNIVSEESSLLDAELDSFGTLMLFAELDNKFSGAFPKNTFKVMDMYDLEISAIIDIIERRINEGN